MSEPAIAILFVRRTRERRAND